MYEIRRGSIYNTDGVWTLVGSPNEEGLEITFGNLDLEVNEAGTFTFTIPKTHSFYGTFKKLEHAIMVKVDNWSSHFFRVISIDRDFACNETITCEGFLGFLKDYICLPYYADVENSTLRYTLYDGYAGAVTLSLRNIISQVIGTSLTWQTSFSSSASVSVTDEPSDVTVLAKLNGGGKTVSEEMRDIIDSFGGFIYYRSVSLTSSGLSITFAYTQADGPGETCTQTIEYGKNLLDLTVEENADDIYTSCIGLGEIRTDILESNSWGDSGRMTAADYQGGTRKICVDASSTYIQKYGRRVVVKQFDGLTTSYQVYKAAKRYISQLVAQNVSIQIKAIDLKALDSTQDGFTCGDLVPIKSTAHGINGTYLCSQAHIDLTDLSQTYYTFGKKLKTASSFIARK